jgi:hypothetical protein
VEVALVCAKVRPGWLERYLEADIVDVQGGVTVRFSQKEQCEIAKTASHLLVGHGIAVIACNWKVGIQRAIIAGEIASSERKLAIAGVRLQTDVILRFGECNA